MKCVGYARVSTESDGQKLSFENQQKYFSKYAKDKGYELLKVYTDEMSGTSIHKRQGILNLLNECGVTVDDKGVFSVTPITPPFNLILISNTSRLGRNLEDVRAIVRCLRENNVYIHFIDSNINTEDMSSDLMLNLLQLFDEQFSQDLSAKVKNGYIKAATTQNVIHSTGRLYGYDYIDRKLIRNEKEAPVVKLIYDLYLQGYGIRRIQNELDKRNIVTRDGNRFGKTTIMNILQNEKYYGLNNRLKYKAQGVFKHSTTPILRDNAQQYYKYSDDIEPIITKDEFDKVQDILNSKRTPTGGIYHGNTPYATKIKCAKCGASYTCNTDRGRKFYNCKTKNTRGITYCDNKNISMKKLDSIFTSEWLVNTLLALKMQRSTHITRIIDKLEQSKDIDTIEEVNAMNEQLSELNQQMERLLDLYLDGMLDKDIYNRRKMSIEKQINDLKASISKLSKGNDEIDDEIQSKRNLIDSINELEVKQSYSQEQVLSYISKLIINDNTIQVYLNINGEEVLIPEIIEW